MAYSNYFESREEVIDFIAFLKDREVTIVPRTKTYHSMFNRRQTYDCTDVVERIAKSIKRRSPEDSYAKARDIFDGISFGRYDKFPDDLWADVFSYDYQLWLDRKAKGCPPGRKLHGE